MYSQVVWIGGMSSLLVCFLFFVIVLCLLFSSVGLSGNIVLICWFFWCEQLWSQIEGFNNCSTALL